MKYSVLFFIFVFIPGVVHCSWGARFSAIRCAMHSYVVAPLRKNFKASCRMSFQSHPVTGYANKQRYPCFAAALFSFGSFMGKTVHCEEKSNNNDWYDLKKPDQFIGLYTPLSLAAQLGDASTFKKLLDAGADPNGAGPFGSALHMAAQGGHLKMVQELVACGADIWQKNDSGRLPIHCATEAGKGDVALFLLALDDEHKTMAHMPCSKKGGNILHVAVEQKLYQLFYTILEHGVDVDRRDAYGMTPLECAVIKDDKSMVSALLQYRALYDPDELVKQAAFLGKKSVFKLLFEHSFNQRSISAGELLIHAVRGGQISIVRYLCDHGANINTCCRGRTPLLEAAESGHDRIVDYLCKKGADVDMQAPWHNAIALGNKKAADILFDAGANPSIYIVHGTNKSNAVSYCRNDTVYEVTTFLAKIKFAFRRLKKEFFEKLPSSR